MDFNIPKDLADYLVELDGFIEREIKPLENENDNIRFFDYRREDARTDWDRGGLPNEEWEALLREARRRADVAGHYRYAAPKEYVNESVRYARERKPSKAEHQLSQSPAERGQGFHIADCRPKNTLTHPGTAPHPTPKTQAAPSPRHHDPASYPSLDTPPPSRPRQSGR